MKRLTLKRKYLFISLGVAAAVALVLQVLGLTNSLAVSAGDWATYDGTQQHTGFNSAEKTLSASNVAGLKVKWSQFAAKGVSDEPIEVGGVVYWGSWDGYFHAFTTSGGHKWDKQLGTTNDKSCDPTETGVASTAAYGTSGSTPAIFVGGGDAKLYALNASNGQVIWSTSLGSSPSHFAWSSPVVVNGSVYMGASSFGDCPLVEGQVLKLSAVDGKVQSTFNAMPGGCLGAGVWSSPALSGSSTSIFITTGNGASCNKSPTYGSALVQLSATNLSVVHSWKVPQNQLTGDADFGSSASVFDAGNNHYVGVPNKNGIYYLFNRDNIGNGPVWQTRIANDSADCPQCGDGSIAPSAWDGSRVYAAGGKTTIGSSSCKGSVRALNPVNHTVIWQHCLQNGPVLSPVITFNGVVAVTQGRDINFFNAATGASLYYYQDNGAGSTFYGGPSVSNGQVFVGNMDGYLYDFGL